MEKHTKVVPVPCQYRTSVMPVALEVKESEHARVPIEYHFHVEMRQPDILCPGATTNKDPRPADFLAEVSWQR